MQAMHTTEAIARRIVTGPHEGNGANDSLTRRNSVHTGGCDRFVEMIARQSRDKEKRCMTEACNREFMACFTKSLTFRTDEVGDA